MNAAPCDPHVKSIFHSLTSALIIEPPITSDREVNSALFLTPVGCCSSTLKKSSCAKMDDGDGGSREMCVWGRGVDYPFVQDELQTKYLYYISDRWDDD